ncbi:hypothetical protein HYC85_010454 [Camellia sinensis]|uniref:Uncharacterized protein n=1 Tax=Camellia sinensis TaxID=4442 RepID=A0A7J7HHX7_CAMSI|nr:hypothetical protein HYC85_010454 [Camellia sinensis]
MVPLFHLYTPTLSHQALTLSLGFPILHPVRVHRSVVPLFRCRTDNLLQALCYAAQFGSLRYRRCSRKNSVANTDLQDEYGLHILKDGQWVGVKHVPGAFVISIGSQLESGVHHALNPDPYSGVFGSYREKYARDVEDLITFGTSGHVAGFISEAIQGVGGIIELAPGYFLAVYSSIKKA